MCIAAITYKKYTNIEYKQKTSGRFFIEKRNVVSLLNDKTMVDFMCCVPKKEK